MITNDFKCHIFNENLILVKSLSLGSRLIQHSTFYDNSDTLVACGIEGVFLFKLHYSGAVEKKHVHKLDPLGTRLNLKLKLYQRLDGIGDWIKGFSMDEEQDILFAWSLYEASVYRLSDRTHYFSY